MRITVGIPTFNRPHWMLRTVQDVLDKNDPSVAEIIVVDQTSWDSIDTRLQEEILMLSKNHLVRYFSIDRASLPLARNYIIQKASAELIVWLDDDVFLPKNFFQEHLKVYDDSSVIAAAGECYHRAPEVDVEDINFSNYESLTIRSFGDLFTYDHLGTMIGANHSVLTRYAIEVKGCDESFGGSGYYSDADFADRLRNMFPAKRIAYNPQAFVIHLRAPTGGCKVDGGNSRSEYENISPFVLYILRNYKGKECLFRLLSLLRIGPLRKYNLIRFWRIPYSLVVFIFAVFILYPKRKLVISSLS